MAFIQHRERRLLRGAGAGAHLTGPTLSAAATPRIVDRFLGLFRGSAAARVRSSQACKSGPRAWPRRSP